jgi:hypothetical protein
MAHMICRKARVFRSRDGFAEIALLEDTFDGDFFIAVRQAPTVRELYRTKLQGAHLVDLFAGYEAAWHCFERRCREFTSRGWQVARAA